MCLDTPIALWARLALGGFVGAYIQENIRTYLTENENMDGVLMLLQLQRLFMPSNPSNTAQIWQEIATLHLHDNETGSDLANRFRSKVEEGTLYELELNNSEMVDILLQVLTNAPGGGCQPFHCC